MNQAPVFDYIDDKHPAVLCGAGISIASGLPAARDMYRLLNDFAADSFAPMLFHRHGAGGDEAYVNPITPIRFEGILEVFQRFVDPELNVLEPYLGGTRAPVHQHLASMARNAPVVTTNVDVLIERNETNLPVFFTERDFVAASKLTNGLWKIHGSVATPNGKRLEMNADGAPVVTLPLISRTRESVAREKIIEELLNNHQVIVLGYSGSDDFDVTRWLRQAASPKKLIWIQWHKHCGCKVTRGNDIEEEINLQIEGQFVYDSGIRRLATAWQRRNQLDRLIVVRTNTPASFIGSNEIIVQPEVASFKLPENPTTWQKYMVTGAMLKQLSYFRTATFYFEKALQNATCNCEKADTYLELGKSLMLLGGPKQNFDKARAYGRKARSCYLQDIPSQSEVSAFEIAEQLLQCNIIRFDRERASKKKLDRTKRDLKKLYDKYSNCENKRSTVAHEALASYLQMFRFEDDNILFNITQDVNAIGLLGPKGMLAHDSALNSWKNATNFDELYTSQIQLQDVIELREDLGDIPGLCGSMNVLGFMYQRLAWLAKNNSECKKYLKQAMKITSRAHDLAIQHELPFHINQTAIGLTVIHLRRHEIRQATELLAMLASRRSELDQRSQLEVEFCNAMQRLAIDQASHTLEHVRDLFRNCQETAEYQVAQAPDQRFSRVGHCARINKLLCEAWLNNAPLSDKGLLEPLSDLKPIIQHNHIRVITTKKAPKNGFQRMHLCLDPLGP